MKDDSYIGIDFGTTNTSVVRILVSGGARQIVPLGEGGEYPFSSIVAIPRDGSNTLKFGREVRKKRHELSATHDIFISMKSYLGTDHEFIVAGERYRAKDITREFLKHIKSYINRTHRIDVTEAVFSFPVDFSPEARRELGLAAVEAGITPIAFVGEATAAYIANREKCRAYSNAMAIDWGGGTFDISILELKRRRILETSVWGEKIGGDDIDLEMAKTVHALIASTSPSIALSFEEMSPAERDQMISLCELAKMEFSRYDDDYDLTIRDYGPYGTKTVTLSYESFRNIVSSMVLRKIIPALDMALLRAETARSAINAVIVVGGSSNNRPFAEAITAFFGPDKIIIPDSVQWSVATGAALIGIIGDRFLLNDDLCVQLSDRSLYSILKKDVHGVGSAIDPVTFSLTEDATDARFVFVSGDGNYRYAALHVPTKGFLREQLRLSAKIGSDQIAVITIENRNMGKPFEERAELNKLTFYYDTTPLG